MKTPSEKARISDMIEAIMKVAAGDYSVQVETSGRNDTLDSLAMGLNMMIDDLKNNKEKDKQQVEDLENMYDELRATQLASLNIMEDLNLQKQELEVLTTQLQLEIVERKRVDEALEQNTHDLDERVKELDCLYDTSKMMVQLDKSIEVTLQQIVERIPSSMQYPEITCARINYEGQEMATDNYKDTSWKQSADIGIHGKKVGTVEVCYLEERPESYEGGSFLKEEHNILEALARELGKFIERKRAEDALRFSDAAFKSIQESVVATDMEYTITHWNNISEQMYGIKASEAVGKKRFEVIEIIDPAPDEVAEQFKLEEAQGYYQCEQLHRTEHGKVWVNMSVQAMEASGKRTGWVALASNISERKRIEETRLQLMDELETKNNELNDFAYIVSHDLKAPLRGISSLAEWIVTDYSDKLDDGGKEQMTLLLNRVKRMHGLIEGIIQYSRIGRIVEEKQEIDLNLLVDEVIDTLDPPENITVDVLNELPTVMLEPTRIDQVFQNLIGNAVKYMDKEKGKITVDCKDEDEFWTFSIADNGPGIDEKYHDKIFQIFQTLKPRDEFESTGIGLTIVKKIIDTNGGKIWVESKVGEGSTFYFTNPKGIISNKQE